jgi:alkylation response protein AidB-like acyl-CoA dehydrogenase
LRFDDFEVPLDAVLGQGVDDRVAEHKDVIRDSLAAGVLAQCWGASGAMEMLVEQTVVYVRHRKQFGRPLADFQAVQHRLAEMGVQSIEARACCELASIRAASGEEWVALATATKAKLASAANLVAKSAVQLHGAMGVCDELPVAPAFRWLEAFQTQWGRAAAHAAHSGRRQLAWSRSRFVGEGGAAGRQRRGFLAHGVPG